MPRETIASLRKRAEQAEAKLAAQDAAIRAALAGMEQRHNDRAALMGIEHSGRIIKFRFVRNNVVTTIETYGTWDDDVAGWCKALLEPLP